MLSAQPPLMGRICQALEVTHSSFSAGGGKAATGAARNVVKQRIMWELTDQLLTRRENTINEKP